MNTRLCQGQGATGGTTVDARTVSAAGARLARTGSHSASRFANKATTSPGRCSAHPLPLPAILRPKPCAQSASVSRPTNVCCRDYSATVPGQRGHVLQQRPPRQLGRPGSLIRELGQDGRREQVAHARCHDGSDVDCLLPQCLGYACKHQGVHDRQSAQLRRRLPDMLEPMLLDNHESQDPVGGRVAEPATRRQGAPVARKGPATS